MSMLRRLTWQLSPLLRRVPDWATRPVQFTSDNLGINLPWLELHDGAGTVVVSTWLAGDYAPALIEADLAAVRGLGLRRIRIFCTVESICAFDGRRFEIVPAFAAHLDDVLRRAHAHGIAVICVLGDGNSGHAPQSLDGKFRWPLLLSGEGRRCYADAYAAFIRRFEGHPNILMWDLHNEPYAEMTWSVAAMRSGVSVAQVHDYLKLSYETLKPLAGGVPVGFSDLEECQQKKYSLFSDATQRRRLVDDCTDIYAMHIYRPSPALVADFRGLTGKPKWACELGALNYDDPDARHHPIPGANELYDPDSNDETVRALATMLINAGFELVMPWAFASNPGFVTHRPDGSHHFGPLAEFIRAQLVS